MPRYDPFLQCRECYAARVPTGCKLCTKCKEIVRKRKVRADNQRRRARKAHITKQIQRLHQETREIAQVLYALRVLLGEMNRHKDRFSKLVRKD